MALRQIKLGETTAALKRVYFHCVDATDGITPETGEAGGQPQISRNGGAFSSTGIGVLVAIGNGRYYAELTDAAVGSSATLGDRIETRYNSANAAEAPGDSVEIVALTLYSASAALLALSAGAMVAGTVEATVAPTTTTFEADDITEATANHFNGRSVLWTSGALIDQATRITDYSLASGKGRFTVQEMTEAPADNDTFIII